MGMFCPSQTEEVSSSVLQILVCVVLVGMERFIILRFGELASMLPSKAQAAACCVLSSKVMMKRFLHKVHSGEKPVWDDR